MHRRVFDEPGHAHFLTFSCAARRQLLNQDRCKRIVIHHLEAVRAEYDGLCFGFVMMPEHVHALVRFRETGQLSLFKQEWKRRSSISLFDYFEQAGNPIVEHLIRADGTHRIWTPKQYDFNVFTHEKVHARQSREAGFGNDPGRMGLQQCPLVFKPQIRRSGVETHRRVNTRVAKLASSWVQSTRNLSTDVDKKRAFYFHRTSSQSVLSLRPQLGLKQAGPPRSEFTGCGATVTEESSTWPCE